MSTTTRKRKQAEQRSAPPVQLAELKGEQIEAVTKTFNDLRANGVDSEVELPKTVVAGDTSSGKSSVMSRLTGLPFPRGEGVLTRFVTEVEMKPADEEEITVKIIPEESRSAKQSLAADRFARVIGLDDFESTFSEASRVMERNGKQALIKDVLRITVKGPKCPPLTVIDLPGLIHAPTDAVTREDMKTSKELVEEYIKGSRTIVLAVISASNEVVNQAITCMTRAVDADGERTMGIVTKIDTVKGKQKEQQLSDTLRNKVIPLSLGWHALVNMVEDVPDASEAEITKAEARLFNQTNYAALDKTKTGIEALRARVVQIVGRKLVETLPDLRHEVETRLEIAKTSLAALGDSRGEIGEQKRFLTTVSRNFEKLVVDEINGEYSGSYSLQVDKPIDSTLRANIEAMQTDFAQAMRYFGSAKRFEGVGLDADLKTAMAVSKSNVYGAWHNAGNYSNRAAVVQWVLKKQKACRGNERPGHVNSQALTQIFRELSAKWAVLTRVHIESIISACKERVEELLAEVTGKAGDVAGMLSLDWVDPHLEALQTEALNVLEDLTRETHQALKTYDLRLESLTASKTKAWHKVESDELDLAVRQAAEQHNARHGTQARPASPKSANVGQATAVSTLIRVHAYYEIDLEHWITSVAKRIVERFVSRLPEAVSFERVMNLQDDEITALAAEPKEIAAQRKKLNSTVEKMEFALRQLRLQQASLK